MRKIKKFHLKFTEHEHLLGNRKKDSNYYRQQIASKKITYLHSLIENIDQLAIVSSLDYPKIKPGLIDRFLILSHHFNKKPFIILTKSDLVSLEEQKYYHDIYALFYQIFIISNEKYLQEKDIFKSIKKLFKDSRTAIVGHSGVGKTSLLNHLDHDYRGMVKEVSSFTKKGRHTTTRIKKHDFSFGGVVYDMPGLKEVDYIDLKKNQVKNYYPEFRDFEKACIYKNCLHNREPNCGVKVALEENSLHSVRYQNYLNILASINR